VTRETAYEVGQEVRRRLFTMVDGYRGGTRAVRGERPGPGLPVQDRRTLSASQLLQPQSSAVARKLPQVRHEYVRQARRWGG